MKEFLEALNDAVSFGVVDHDTGEQILRSTTRTGQVSLYNAQYLLYASKKARSTIPSASYSPKSLFGRLLLE